MTLGQRLHPASLVFFAIDGLKQIWPLALGAVVLGRGLDELWLWLALTTVIVLVATLGYLRFRYELRPDSIHIRSGLVLRRIREIPRARIQNLVIVEGLLHRLLGVITVRLETGSGVGEDAELKVIDRSAFAELEALVSSQRVAEGAGSSDLAIVEEGRILVELGSADLIRYGLLSNRGMVIIAGALAVLFEVGLGNWLDQIMLAAVESSSGLDLNVLERSFMVGLLITLGIAIARLLSLVVALTQFHGYRLTRIGDRLHCRYGLLTRVSGALPIARIQRIEIQEPLLFRWFGYCSIRVQSAAAQTVEGEAQQFRWITPLLRRDQADALLIEIDAGLDPSKLAWASLPQRAMPAMLAKGALVLAPIGALVLLAVPWPFGLLAIGALAIPTVVIGIGAYLTCRYTHYAVNPSLVAGRFGNLSRHCWLVLRRRIQSLALSQGPIDRSFDLCSVAMDTAGSDLFGEALTIDGLALEDGLALVRELR